MKTDDPEKLRRRITDLVEAWAPPHARELLEAGWRLSDGGGLTWVRDDKPSLHLSDDDARKIHGRHQSLRQQLRSAGDYRDAELADRLEEELAALPTYEQAGMR